MIKTPIVHSACHTCTKTVLCAAAACSGMHNALPLPTSTVQPQHAHTIVMVQLAQRHTSLSVCSCGMLRLHKNSDVCMPRHAQTTVTCAAVACRGMSAPHCIDRGLCSRGMPGLHKLLDLLSKPWETPKIAEKSTFFTFTPAEGQLSYIPTQPNPVNPIHSKSIRGRGANRRHFTGEKVPDPPTFIKNKLYGWMPK